MSSPIEIDLRAESVPALLVHVDSSAPTEPILRMIDENTSDEYDLIDALGKANFPQVQTQKFLPVRTDPAAIYQQTVTSSPHTPAMLADYLLLSASASFTADIPTTGNDGAKLTLVARNTHGSNSITVSLSGSYITITGAAPVVLAPATWVMFKIERIQGVWVVLGRVTSTGSGLVGPQGATGATGAAGPTGDEGPQGATGRPAGLYYQFSNNTATYPASGKGLTFNNSTLASVTEVRLHNLNEDGANVAAIINTWDDSSSAVKGTLVIQQVSNPTNLVVFSVSAVDPDPVSDGLHKKVSVTYVTSNGTINDDAFVVLQFSRTGDAA